MTGVERSGVSIRRLRRPTAGASHAPSDAGNPLCRDRGFFCSGGDESRGTTDASVENWRKREGGRCVQ